MSKDNKKKKKKSRDIIHEHLAISLLLPNHPFSEDLHNAISMVGPMFPSVVFVVTNAFEFKDFCAQYNVHAFPKLLFFKKGILAGRYTGKHTVDSLAAQIAHWTETFPSSYPIVPSISLLIPLRPAQRLSQNNGSFIPLLIGNLMSGPSTEPFKAHIEIGTGLYDNHLLFISLLYIVAKFIYICYRICDSRSRR